MWVTLHGSPTSGAETQSCRKQLTLLISICNDQLAAGRHLVLYASEYNHRVWQNAAFRQFLSMHCQTLALQAFTGRLCNLGIKRPSDGKPSDRLQRVISSTSLSSLSSTCTCGVGAKLHVQDGNGKAEDRNDGDRREILLQMAESISTLILRSLVGSSTLCSKRSLRAATGPDLADPRLHDERRIQPKSIRNISAERLHHQSI